MRVTDRRPPAPPHQMPASAAAARGQGGGGGGGGDEGCRPPPAPPHAGDRRAPPPEKAAAAAEMRETNHEMGGVFCIVGKKLEVNIVILFHGMDSHSKNILVIRSFLCFLSSYRTHDMNEIVIE